MKKRYGQIIIMAIVALISTACSHGSDVLESGGVSVPAPQPTTQTAITFSGQRNVDAIADLKTTMVKEFCDLKERDMQEKINSLTASNSLLRSQIDNAAQTAAIAGLIAPVAKEVDDIKCRMPQTVPVQWPQLTAVNTTPYVSGGFYGNGWNNCGFGNNGLYF